MIAPESAGRLSAKRSGRFGAPRRSNAAPRDLPGCCPVLCGPGPAGWVERFEDDRRRGPAQ